MQDARNWTSSIFLDAEENRGHQNQRLHDGRSGVIPDQETAGRINMASVGNVEAEAERGPRFRKKLGKADEPNFVDRTQSGQVPSLGDPARCALKPECQAMRTTPCPRQAPAAV